MEEWQRKHITKNLVDLILLTKFDGLVKAELEAHDLLTQYDIDSLDAVETRSGKSEACRQYYKLLMGRTDAYKVLTKALMQFSQSGAAKILIRVPTELYSKPLTYLGISTELQSFKDAKIEVNGKTLKLQEFFPAADYGKLQQIFQSCLTELQIYDTFITKGKTLLVANNSTPPKPPYYVPRFISNRIKLNTSVFKADCLDVFVFKKTIPRYKLSEIANPHFTGTSTSQLNTISSRFIYLEEDQDWIEVKKIATVPIHLINYEADQSFYLLEDSSAPSGILRILGCREERVYMTEEEFVQQQLSEECSSPSICICDVPGMGKTFLLANIARVMAAEKCVGRIVVFIQLTSFADNFLQDSRNKILTPEITIKNVLNYICAPAQNPALLLTLIKAEILRLEIFFDGFDEIPTEKVECTKQVFHSITANFPKIRIYITSRPHMRQHLEERLGVVAYDILPFHKQNQIDFLVQYWQNSEPNSDNLSLQSYATSCLKSVDEFLTNHEKEIAGIPLLCQLIAEVYSDKVAVHSIKRRKISNFILQISGMYQKFIKKKIELVAKDQNEFDNIKMVHIWYALKLLFPTNGFHNDKPFKKYNDFLTYDILMVGILQKHSNGALEFIHRTFAENLIAEYFFTTLMEKQKTVGVNSDSMSILKLLLRCIKTKKHDGLFTNYNFYHPVIVSFFNSAFVKDRISEELKMRAAAFVSFISHEEFIDILCASCQHNLVNIFGLLTESLTKWDTSRILDCFTNENSCELLSICLREPTSQLFQKCVQLLAEVLKLDLEQINKYDKINTLLQTAVLCVNYEAVEYLLDKVSFQNQILLEKCVKHSYIQDDNEKRYNILYLLHNKNPALIHETPDILRTANLDVRFFKIWVKLGANLTAADKIFGNCAMHAAIHMSPTNYHELVQFLLTDCKAEYLFLEKEKWKDPLPYIIQHATLLPETLAMLFNIPGIDVNIKDEKGENLLFSAAKRNKTDNFQLLLKRGLDYNAKGNGNRSLLHVAAEWGGVEMIRYLLSLKLDPNSRDQNKRTPLHYAAKSIYGTLSVVEVLVENGANVQAKNNVGQTALHISATNYNPDREVIKYLIVNGVRVNDRDDDGNTPLHLCKEEKAKDCLIEMGADTHVKNKDGQTPAQMNPRLWKCSDTEDKTDSNWE